MRVCMLSSLKVFRFVYRISRGSFCIRKRSVGGRTPALGTSAYFWPRSMWIRGEVQDGGGAEGGVNLKCNIQEDWETLSKATSCK
jgi:hypothetical protein